MQFLSRINPFFHLFRTLTVVLILSAKVKVSVEKESSNLVVSKSNDFEAQQTTLEKAKRFNVT